MTHHQTLAMLERFGFQIKCALDRGKHHTLETLALLTKSTASKTTEAEGEDANFSSDADESSASLSDEDDNLPVLLAPSESTVSVITSLYRRLFTVSGKIDLTAVNQALAQCPDEEDILAVEDRDHYNLLHKAIIFDDIELAELLAGRVADVNALRSCGIRCPHSQLGPLHLASFLGRRRLVVWLLALGADSRALRRVYISAPVDCPANRQLAPLCCGRDEQMGRLLSTCGPRDAAFFAVIADSDHTMLLLLLNGGQWNTNNEVSEQIVNDDTSQVAERSHQNCVPSNDEDPAANAQRMTINDSDISVTVHADDDADMRAMADSVDARYGYLLHVACRVGALRCLGWLLRFYPSELCVSASDGLPALLLALPHGHVPVRMLLHAGADVHDVQHFWEEGRNILHLLYAALPFRGPCAGGLSDVTELCIAGGASVCEERQSAGRTPLHDLMAAFNCVHGGNTNSDTVIADLDLLQCMRALLTANAPVGVSDADGRTPLAVLTANQHYISRMSSDTTANCYGLDNTATAVSTLLAAMSVDHAKDELPLLEFLAHLPLDSSEDDVFAGCCRVLNMLAKDCSLSDLPLACLLDRIRAQHEVDKRCHELIRIMLRCTSKPAPRCVEYLQRVASQRDNVAVLLPLCLQYIPPSEFTSASNQPPLITTFCRTESRDIVTMLSNHDPYQQVALRSAIALADSPDMVQFMESRMGVPTLKSWSRYRIWCELWKLPDPFSVSQRLSLPASMKLYLQSFTD